MIREALEYLFNAGRQSADVIVKPAAEPPHVYYVRRPDGSLDFRAANPAPTAHAPLSLASLVALAVEWGAAVWHSPEAVVAVDGRDRATLALAKSEPFALLEHWAKNRTAMPQADLIRELRIKLAGCLGPAGNLLDLLRVVRFKTGSDTVAEIDRGRSSIGRQLQSEVTGTDRLPEVVAFSVPVFATPSVAGIRSVVQCALDPDAATGTFRVIPLPGQLEAATEYAAGEVGAIIRDLIGDAEGIPVYHGRP